MLAAGAVATSPFLRPARALASTPDVVVVGAGAAGMAAAKTLLARGLEVVIVEAAPRVGGRAWTESERFGVPYDRGCMWLQGPADLPHVDLARSLGYTLVDHSNAREVVFVGDRRADAAERRQSDRAWSRVYRALATVPGDVAAGSVIPRGDPFVATVETWLGPLDFGVDLDEMSTADWNAYADLEVDYLVREGLGAVAERYGEGLPVQTGTAVTAVDWSGRDVRVDTTAGSIHAKACILTVSTGVLASGAIRFTPDLPDWKQEAIAGVPMGLLVNIGLLFDGTRFGLGSSEFLTYKVPPPVPAEACFFLTFPSDHDYITGFAGGRFGWDPARAGTEEAVHFALDSLVGMLGSDVRRHFLRGQMSDWDSNPLTLGAYSAARPGQFAARAELARPLGERVFFAGEAMATPYAALLSGAHLHGEATAREVAGLLTGQARRGRPSAGIHNPTPV